MTGKRRNYKKVREKEEREVNNNEEVGWVEWIVDKTSFALVAIINITKLK